MQTAVATKSEEHKKAAIPRQQITRHDGPVSEEQLITADPPLFLRGRIQTKLTVGGADDPLEREADQVAEQVMRSVDGNGLSANRMVDDDPLTEAGPFAFPRFDNRPRSGGDAGVQRKCACGGSSFGECEECRKRKDKLPATSPIQRRTSNGSGSGVTDAPPIVDQALSSPGRPLDPLVCSLMETRFGHDFGDVRVHTDPLAEKSAQAVNALAYTHGKDLVFAPRQYEPESNPGKRLIAHELTHVVQLGAGVASGEPASVMRQEPPGATSQAGTPAIAPPPANEPPTTPLTDEDKHDLQTLQEVLSSGKGDNIYKIKNPNVANDAQKLEIIRIACGMNFLFAAAILAQWWSSFGDQLPEVATANLADWTNSVQVDSGLKYLPQVKKTQDAFVADIDGAATENLWENRNYILARKATLGLEPGSSKDALSEAQKAEWRHQVQDMAYQVWEFKQAQAKLRKTVVGYMPMAFAPPDPIYFNPDSPQYDRFKGVQGNRPEWSDLKLAWDLISAEIARIAAKYPEIYGALASEKPEDELLNMSRLIPGAFEKNTARLLDEMLVRIDDTQTKLGTSIDYLDLQPLIRRLLQGGAAPSGRRWNIGFHQWAAQTLVGDRAQAEKAADTAATALEVIGLLVATFASGGLALLVGGTLAVGVPVARGISDWSRANELDQVAKSTPKAGTDLVAQAQADSLKAKGVGEVIRGVFNAITLGGAAAWGAVRGALTAAKLGRIGELSAVEAADLLQKALGQLGAAKTVASTGKTIEELLTIAGENSVAAGPLRAFNADLMAKPLAEITAEDYAASLTLQNRIYNMAQAGAAIPEQLAKLMAERALTSRGSLMNFLAKVWNNRQQIVATKVKDPVYKMYRASTAQGPAFASEAEAQAYDRLIKALVRGRKGIAAPQGDVFYHFLRAGVTEKELQAVTERVYLNTAPGLTPGAMEEVVRNIVDNPVAFPGVVEAKVALSGQIGARSESIVIYCENAESSAKVLKYIRGMREEPNLFRAETPPMTQPVFEGVSVGQEPMGYGGQESFGGIRSSIIEDTLRQAVQDGVDEGTFINRVLQAFQQRGIDPVQPHLNLPPGATP